MEERKLERLKRSEGKPRDKESGAAIPERYAAPLWPPVKPGRMSYCS